MGTIMSNDEESSQWRNLGSRSPACGGLHDPWTRWMVREAEPDDWEQVHAMWGMKKLHGALMPAPGAHCYLYLDRRIWGSPPPLEAQPVASSGRPQPVAGSRSKYVLKSTRISIMKVFTICCCKLLCPYERRQNMGRHGKGKAAIWSPAPKKKSRRNTGRFTKGFVKPDPESFTDA